MLYFVYICAVYIVRFSHIQQKENIQYSVTEKLLSVFTLFSSPPPYMYFIILLIGNYESSSECKIKRSGPKKGIL